MYSYQTLIKPYVVTCEMLEENQAWGFIIPVSITVVSMLLGIFVNPFLLKFSDSFVFYSSFQDFIGKTFIFCLLGLFYPITVYILYTPIFLVLGFPLLLKKFVFKLD